VALVLVAVLRAMRIDRHAAHRVEHASRGGRGMLVGVGVVVVMRVRHGPS
jgi:hypothetical protein